MILDDKVIMSLPPPPYLPNHNHSAVPSSPPPPFSESQHGTLQAARPLKLSSLPPHILLQIVYNSFPTHPSLDTGLGERQRKILLWLAKSLRLVNKSFYIACMHVLRSTYLPAYLSLLRPYYSSDPFPSTPVPQAYSSTLNTVQRETPILDLFIALKVREDVYVDDSELHLEREDMFKDIFDLAQPKARIEDIVRIYGVKEGLVTLSPPGVITYTSASASSSYLTTSTSTNNTFVPELPLSSPPPPSSSRSSTSRFFPAFMRYSKTPSPPATIYASPSSSSSPSPSSNQTPQRSSPRIRPIPFSLLSVSFGTRKVGLQLMSVETGSKRTIVQVQRMSRDERLETAAARIVTELRRLLVA